MRGSSRKGVTVRDLAVMALLRVEKEKAYAKNTVERLSSERGLAPRDRSFLTELTYGTLRNITFLDWIISAFSKRDITKLSPAIRNILRLGIYQLRFMDGVPESAAVNEAVESAKRFENRGAAGFVNGILRSSLREWEKVRLPDPEQDPIKHISVLYSHPEWIVSRCEGQYGIDTATALCRWGNRQPALWLRVNHLKTTKAELSAMMKTTGIMVDDSEPVPEAVKVIGEAPAITDLPGYSEGLFQVQDISSMLVAHVVRPLPGETVIDSCAAPGGKATHMAEMMKNCGSVLAGDIHEFKLRLIQENAERLGIDIIKTFCSDSRRLCESVEVKADRVLIDAPCSGLGVLGRRPDSRWHRREEEIPHLAGIQRALLRSAAELLKPGGVLVYSTCTTEREENSDQVEALLGERDDIVPSPFGEVLPREIMSRFDIGAGEWYLQLLPNLHATDGFFIARMRKRD